MKHIITTPMATGVVIMATHPEDDQEPEFSMHLSVRLKGQRSPMPWYVALIIALFSSPLLLWLLYKLL